MTHKHFITGVLLAAVAITGIQVSGGFAEPVQAEQPNLAWHGIAPDTAPTG